MISFLQTAFPDFRTRGGSDNPKDRWGHVGCDVAYIALEQEGNDWEFVQYLSDDPAAPNDYELPDR